MYHMPMHSHQSKWTGGPIRSLQNTDVWNFFHLTVNTLDNFHPDAARMMPERSDLRRAPPGKLRPTYEIQAAVSVFSPTKSENIFSNCLFFFKKELHIKGGCAVSKRLLIYFQNNLLHS